MTTTRNFETLPLHFDLRHCPKDVVFTLRVCGRHYRLQQHTAESIAAHARRNRALALLPHEQQKHITHYVEDVHLPADAVGLHSVVYPSADPARLLPELALVFIHVPSGARRRNFRKMLRSGRGLRVPTVLARYGVTELPPGEEEEALFAATLLKRPHDSAATIVASHPDVASLNPGVTSSVLDQYIDAALDIDPALTDYISENPDTWYSETIQTAPDGTVMQPTDQLTDSNGDPIPWTQQSGQTVISEYKLSDDITGTDSTSGAATGVIQTVVQQVKQDPAFAGQLWTTQTGVATQQQTQVSPTLSSERRRPMRGATAVDDDNYIWSMNFLSSQYGLDLDQNSLQYNNGQLSLRVKNWANRGLGAYVQFLEANQNPISNPAGWVEQLPDSLRGDLEPNDSKKYLDLISSGNMVFGIPVGTDYRTLSFSFPPTAVRADVLLGGLGQGAYDSEVDLPGMIDTIVMNYGVPFMLTALSVGLQSTAWYQSLMADPDNKYALYSVGFFLVAGAAGGAVGSGMMSPAQLLEKAASFVIGLILKKGMEFLAQKITGYVTAQEIMDNVPFMGWAVRVASIASALAAMAATTIEVALSPGTYRISVSRAIGLKVTVSPDPIHAAAGQKPIWPDSSDHWVITAQMAGGTTPFVKQGWMPVDPTAPIEVYWDAIPAAPGDLIQVTANIYSSSQWLCGRWVSQWYPAVANIDTTLEMQGSIIESLVPLTVSTRYSHVRRLDFKSGAHYWIYDEQPSEMVSSLHCASSGNQLCELVDMTMNNDAYALGYCWKASGQNLPLDFGKQPSNAQMYSFQSISALSNPEAGMKSPTVGFSLPANIVYDQFGMQPLFSVASSYTSDLNNGKISQELSTDFANASSNYALPQNAAANVVTRGQQWTIGVPDQSTYTPIYTLTYSTDGKGALINVASYSNPALLFTIPSTFQTELDAQQIGDDLRKAFAAATVSYALPQGAVAVVITASAEWTIGLPQQTPLYDLKRSVDSIGVFPYPAPAFSKRNFYLNGRTYQDDKGRTMPVNGLYFLRQVYLGDGNPTFDYSVGQSFGTFAQPNLSALVIHPSGYAVAVSNLNSKMEVLTLPSAAAPDAQAQPASLVSGKGDREGLMQGPVAMTVTPDGRILVLEQGNARVQAFDTVGNPVQCFAGPLSFPLDASFAPNLDQNTIPLALQQAYQQSVQPVLAAVLPIAQTFASQLNDQQVSSDLIAAFNSYSVTLSASAQVSVTAPNKLWLITDPENGGAYDVRPDPDSPSDTLNVYQAATLQTEVKAPGSEWLLRDKTNSLVWDLTRSSEGSKINAHQLIATFPLKDRPGSNVTYLDLKTETKSFIYVLSYANQGTSLQDYHLDIYNPDGTFLCRTPDPGKNGVNAARFVVDQWRNVYTLNYGYLLGPGGRTEPKVSIWVPSTP